MLHITDSEFEKIRDILYKRTGMFLRETKQSLVATRLRARLQELGLASFEDYVTYVHRSGPQEMEHLINAITTNETYFFRCDKQIDYVKDVILPRVISDKRARKDKVVNIWSAGCSNGPEPYTLAMLIDHYFVFDKDIKFNIYATDINSEVLKEAKEAVYSSNCLRGVPVDIKEKYFVKSVDCKYKETYEVNDFIKNKVQFSKHNLKDLFYHDQIDIVFIRNVLIYFDTDSRKEILDLIKRVTVPHGYLLLGLSESLIGTDTRFKIDQLGVYRLS